LPTARRKLKRILSKLDGGQREFAEHFLGWLCNKYEVEGVERTLRWDKGKFRKYGWVILVKCDSKEREQINSYFAKLAKKYEVKYGSGILDVFSKVVVECVEKYNNEGKRKN